MSQHLGTATKIGVLKLALHSMCGGQEVLDKVKVFVWSLSYLMVAKSVQNLGVIKGCVRQKGGDEE